LIVLSCCMDWSKLIHGKIEKWISIIYKLLHGFVKVATWVCQGFSTHFSPFAKLNQDEV